MFANPGTTEMHIVGALDTAGVEMRSILCLHETVCTGAADGYGRMKGKPAATLLHLGVGLANGIANLHNARRARSVVRITFFFFLFLVNQNVICIFHRQHLSVSRKWSLSLSLSLKILTGTFSLPSFSPSSSLFSSNFKCLSCLLSNNQISGIERCG